LSISSGLDLCQAGNYDIAAWSRNPYLHINEDCLCGNQPVPQLTLETMTSAFDEAAYEVSRFEGLKDQVERTELS